jgi:hypothetical protein
MIAELIGPDILIVLGVVLGPPDSVGVAVR